MSVFENVVLDVVENALDTLSDAWLIDRMPDYIRVTRTRTGQVAIVHAIHIIDMDDVAAGDPHEDPFLLRAVENELEKGVPEHE